MTPTAVQRREPAALFLTPDHAEALTGGRWHGPRNPVTVRGATLDSRAVIAGQAFICIRGVRVDGHDFAAAAVGAGAVLIVATRPFDLPAAVLVCADPARALAALATALRRQLNHIRWIGIAGSNGKTTTKELIAAACAPLGVVHATRGNLNNHLGVPLTVLATPLEAAVAIIELGANHPGELAELTTIVQPDLGVITSFGPEHLEGFGSLAGVVKAECELLGALPANAFAGVGLGGLAGHADTAGGSVADLLAVIHAAGAHVRLRLLAGADPRESGDLIAAGHVAPDGIHLACADGSVALPLLGAHNLANATLAWHAAVAAGVEPVAAREALAGMRPVAGRLVPRAWGVHRILDDTYNANPASMIAGLEVLNAQPGAKLAVLGAMAELGHGHDAAHDAVGAACARLGLPLIVVGERAIRMVDGYRAAGGTAVSVVADARAAAALVRVRCQTPTTVLVKASRSSALDKVVNELFTDASAAC